MPESKYGKHIVSTLRPPAEEAPWSPPIKVAGGGKGGRVLFLDNDVVPGSFYTECVWVMPYEAGNTPVTESHAHEYDEVVAFFGTDPINPGELGAEVELWLEDEKHIIAKSSLVFIPAGMHHCPLTFLKIDRPVFHFTTGPGKMYV